MCRLVAIAGSITNHPTKVLLMDALMNRAQADQNQAFGTGISDTKTVIKSGLPYGEIDAVGWMQQLNHEMPWFGHLRKPSAGVSAAATEASHPFYFPTSALIAAHNGYIADVTPKDAEDGKPFVDSYYAFEMLDALLGRAGEITKALLDEWIAYMGPGSEYSFMFAHRGDLWVLRGIRPMFSITLNKHAQVYCTSDAVLRSTASMTEHLWPNAFAWGKKIELMPEHSIINTRTNRGFKLRSPAPRITGFPIAQLSDTGEWIYV